MGVDIVNKELPNINRRQSNDRGEEEIIETPSSCLASQHGASGEEKSTGKYK